MKLLNKFDLSGFGLPINTKKVARQIARTVGDPMKETRPLFSILHPSARPDQWRKIYDAWIKAAVNPQDVEYVLVTDERWGFLPVGQVRHDDRPGNIVISNPGRRCYVDAVNTAAKAATGSILIVIADDQWPEASWDQALELAIGNGYGSVRNEWGLTIVEPEIVVSVSTGTPDEHQRGIMVMPILSRARYERLGYVFYPEYESMYADNDFCESARQDGVMILAHDLMFPHKHPLFDGSGKWATQPGKMDAAYDAQNREESYKLGKSVLDRRRAANFDGIAPVEKSGTPVIAVCLPGESFSHYWVAAWQELFVHLLKRGFHIAALYEYYSNASFTRQILAERAMMANPDYILWIDDDQLVTPEAFDHMMSTLLGMRADIVAGWTWIPGNEEHPAQVSAGMHNGDVVTFVPRAEIERIQKLEQPFEVEWTGFPAVLMTAATITKANEQAMKSSKMPSAFCPIYHPNSKFGVTGEDVAFCVYAKAAGCKIYVDSRAFVPHLKLRKVDPGPVKAPQVIEFEKRLERDEAMRDTVPALEYTGV